MGTETFLPDFPRVLGLLTISSILSSLPTNLPWHSELQCHDIPCSALITFLISGINVSYNTFSEATNNCIYSHIHFPTPLTEEKVGEYF